MSCNDLFRQLAPAYFTVTVCQANIDLWNRRGGRTTFSARNTKTSDSPRLVPAINIVDGLTGLPYIRELSVHGAAPLNRDVSGCRLPILVFCGNDDDGLHLADDEYLGQPLEHDKECIIFSERWIIDSLSAGRLLKMADYAKHAPVGWNIDEPSLYFPCPFPPTYHAVTGSRTAGSHQAECRREQNSIGTGAASVMIVGADFPLIFCPAQSLSSTDRSANAPKPSFLLNHSNISRPCSEQLKTATGLASLPQRGCKRLPESDARHSVATPLPSSGRLRRLLPSTECSIPLEQDRRPVLPDLLADYIMDKKQTYLHSLRQQADLKRRRETEARELAEEQIVDSVLVDSARNIASMYPCGEVSDSQAGGANQCLRECESATRSTGTPLLVLEASLLLRLLPPLRMSRAGFPTRTGDTSSCRSFTRIPCYYPYLTMAALQPEQDLCRTDSHEDDLGALSAGEKVGEASQAPPRGVIAFHSSGYGVGWADFEACDDWVFLPKRRVL